MEDVEKQIRAYLPTVLHTSLATTNGTSPWVCELHFVYDDDLNLYFRSKESRRHSEDIAKNPAVAGNIVEHHGPNTKPLGVYYEGEASLIDVKTAKDPIYKLFSSRLMLNEEIIEDATFPDGHRFFKITVSDYYLFDARNRSPGEKLHLPWN